MPCPSGAALIYALGSVLRSDCRIGATRILLPCQAPSPSPPLQVFFLICFACLYAAIAALCSYCVIIAQMNPANSLATAVAALHRSLRSAIRQNFLYSLCCAFQACAITSTGCPAGRSLSYPLASLVSETALLHRRLSPPRQAIYVPRIRNCSPHSSRQAHAFSQGGSEASLRQESRLRSAAPGSARPPSRAKQILQWTPCGHPDRHMRYSSWLTPFLRLFLSLVALTTIRRQSTLSQRGPALP